MLDWETFPYREAIDSSVAKVFSEKIILTWEVLSNFIVNEETILFVKYFNNSALFGRLSIFSMCFPSSILWFSFMH